MTQKEEKSKLLSQKKVPTFEEDFQQPEKRLVTIESLEQIREAQRKDPYIAKLHHQDDQFFFAEEYNIKRMIRITEFKRWFETVYARRLNVLRNPTYVESGDLKNELTMHSKLDFRSHVLVSFDVKKISTNQLYIHKKTEMNI
uniref:Uncharacterized protein n=1 Tax=Romanomermis culicivorax TaxID=13658 RepID=A0A915JSW8_ROMCU